MFNYRGNTLVHEYSMLRNWRLSEHNSWTGKGCQHVWIGNKSRQVPGIPYAMPPVGDLRFKDPVPRKTWNNTWNATEFTPFCAMAGLEMSEEIKMSEDCLYLNVFVPEVSFFPYLNSCFSIRGRKPSTLAHLQILKSITICWTSYDTQI